MNDESMTYIATPRSESRPVRITTLLEQRMKEFLLSRRQKQWYKGEE